MLRPPEGVNDWRIEMADRCMFIAHEIVVMQMDDWCNLPAEEWHTGRVILMGVSPQEQQHRDQWAGVFERG